MTQFDYIKRYEDKLDKCISEAKESMKKLYDDLDDKCIQEAVEHFEETANAEEVVGYYLSHYGDDAYKAWEDNTSNIELNDEHKSIGEILSSIVLG